MTDIRVDPFTGTAIIVAAARDDRPHEFRATTIRQAEGMCPFCGGNEQETPLAVAHYTVQGDASDGAWQVRVVPNKYPAVATGAAAPRSFPPLLAAHAAAGRHEVIIESPEHRVSWSELSDAEATLCLRAYRDRLREAYATAGICFAQVFKNVGPQAGASLEHLHSQLIATTFVPASVAALMDRCRRHFEQHGKTLLDSLITAELDSHERIITQSEHYVVYCPFAGRFPFETWIAPRQSAANFCDTADDTLPELARLTRDVVRRFESLHASPAYNLLLQNPPQWTKATDASAASCGWYLTMFPRITTPAGWEWATGSFINPIPPEFAAQQLRRVASV